MERFVPKRRRSIHSTPSEVKDNIKNDALMKQRKKPTKMTNKEVSGTDSNEEYSTTDDENHKNYTNSPRSLSNTESKKKIGGEIKKRLTRSSSNERITKNSGSPSNKSRENSHTRKSNRENQKKKESPLTKNSTTSHKNLKSASSNYSKIIVLLISMLLGIATVYIFYPNLTNLPNMHGFNFLYQKNENTNSSEAVLKKVKSALLNLGSKYKNQNKDLWHNAYHGITNLIKEKNKKPSIILLLGKNSDPVDCLATLLGEVSSEALDSDTLRLTPEKFENNVGTVIESLRKKIQEKKVVIIWDLLNVNTEALRAFHNLCDRINPLVDEVIYIMTITSNNYDESMKPLEFIEKELYKKLSGNIKDDAIQPLITRITDGAILTIKPEPTVTDCYLPKVSK